MTIDCTRCLRKDIPKVYYDDQGDPVCETCISMMELEIQVKALTARVSALEDSV